MRTRIMLGLVFATTLAIAAPPDPAPQKNNPNPNGVENLKKSTQKMHDTRVDRRRTHVEEMRAKYRDVIGKPEAQTDIRDHARRVARLHRIRNVAMEMGNTSIVSRVDMLLDKEQKNFDKQMDDLRGKGDKK